MIQYKEGLRGCSHSTSNKSDIAENVFMKTEQCDQSPTDPNVCFTRFLFLILLFHGAHVDRGKPRKPEL